MPRPRERRPRPRLLSPGEQARLDVVRAELADRMDRLAEAIAAKRRMDAGLVDPGLWTRAS